MSSILAKKTKKTVFTTRFTPEHVKRFLCGTQWAIALVLFIAATAKVYAHFTIPHLSVLGTLGNISLIVFEYALAAWLISGLYRQKMWWITFVTFFIFTIITASKFGYGEKSCGCFGSIEVSPIITLILDLLIMAAVITLRLEWIGNPKKEAEQNRPLYNDPAYADKTIQERLEKKQKRWKKSTAIGTVILAITLYACAPGHLVTWENEDAAQSNSNSTVDKSQDDSPEDIPTPRETLAKAKHIHDFAYIKPGSSHDVTFVLVNPSLSKPLKIKDISPE